MNEQSGVISSLQAAKFVCELSQWHLTHLKLQKILYLAQLTYVAINKDLPLIEESFEAWDYGPVLPSLYDRVKRFGKEPIRNIFFNVHFKDIADTVKKHLECIYSLLKYLSGGALLGLTRGANGAWVKNYSDQLNIKIPFSDVICEYKYFFML